MSSKHNPISVHRLLRFHQASFSTTTEVVRPPGRSRAALCTRSAYPPNNASHPSFILLHDRNVNPIFALIIFVFGEVITAQDVIILFGSWHVPSRTTSSIHKATAVCKVCVSSNPSLPSHVH